MSFIPKNILQEVVISSQENAWVNGNCFEFSLLNFINCEGQNVKVGLKNIKFPIKRKTLKVKFHVIHFLEKFEPSEMKAFELSYVSYEDLCQQLEVISFSLLKLDSGGGLDFRTPEKNSWNTSKFVLSINFENNRIIIRKNVNYVMILTDDMNNELRFGAAEKIQVNGVDYWVLSNFLHVSDYCSMYKQSEEVIHIAMYDMIESSTYAMNGSRYPIVCTTYPNNSNRGNNMLLSAKTVSVSYIKKIRCYILNENFEYYDFSLYNLEIDPLIMTLVFFEP